MEENTQEPLISLSVDDVTEHILKETSRWTKFISVVGIIGVAMLLLTLAFAGSIITALYAKVMPGVEALAGILIFFIILVLLVAGFMVFLLYRFSTLTKKGIEMHDQSMFNSGLSSLKTYFIIQGVFAIISLISNFVRLF